MRTKSAQALSIAFSFLIALVSNAPAWAGSAVQPDDQATRLARLEGEVRTLVNTLDKSTWFLGALVAVFTIISIVNTLFDKARATGLIAASQANIESTSALFGALKDMLTLRAKAAELEQHVTALQTRADEQRQQRNDVAKAQNRDAIKIWDRVDRGNYASIERQEEFHQFAIALETRRQEFNLADEELNLACHLIAGLDLRKRDTDARRKLLEHAIDVGQRDLAKSAPSELLRGGIAPERFGGWVRATLNQTHYHLAILFYNQGGYPDAIRHFKSALDHDSQDFGSMLYVCEATFLGEIEEFDAIVTGFEAVRAKLESGAIDQSWTATKRDELLSQMWVRLGNCYYADNRGYRSKRSLTKALECYKRAYERNQEWYLARFSYAQALSARARQGSSIGARPQLPEDLRQLFGKVFPVVRDKLTMTVEPKIRMMLYYMLAICVWEGQIAGELPHTYLGQILPERGNLGSHSSVRIFSPKTKNDLTVDQFIQEAQQYQKVTLAATT